MTTDDLHERLRHLHAPLPAGLIARAQLAATAQVPPPIPPSHRRRILEGLLAAALAAAIALPLYLTHSGGGTASTSGGELVFLTSTLPGSITSATPPSTKCSSRFETTSVGGSMSRSFAMDYACGSTPKLVGDLIVALTAADPNGPGAGLEVLDLGSGTERELPLEGIDGGLIPSPDRTRVAVPIILAPTEIPALDIVDLVTGSVVRLQPRVGATPLNIGESAPAWLSDGIHSVQRCVNSQSTCDYLVSPATGTVRTLLQVGSGPAGSSSYVQVFDSGSPDGTQEARYYFSGNSDFVQTVSAGPTDGTLRTVYAAPAGDTPEPLGVADDGSVLFQVISTEPNGPPAYLTYVASRGGVYPVNVPAGLAFSAPTASSPALPGGGFALEMSPDTAGGAGEEQVVRISDTGSVTMIQPSAGIDLFGITD